MISDKQYGNRCPQTLDEQGGYYFRHVRAMTVEGLHCKHDIAAELAHRDYEIDKLKETIAGLREQVRLIKEYNKGEYEL